MIDRAARDIGAIIREGSAIDHAIETARHRVVRRHRQLGVPLVVWRDGQVVEISAESIRLPEDAPTQSTVPPPKPK
jgi:hypothetical protein